MKTTIRHYFRKSFGPNWTLLTAFIGLWVAAHPANWGATLYSHSEIGFQDRNGNWKLCSATPDNTADGVACVRMAEEKDVILRPEDWDIYEEEVDAQEAVQMELRAARHVGRPYDYLAIIGFIPFGWGIDNPAADYCSELCHIVRCGFRRRVSPTLWGKETKRRPNTKKCGVR